MVGVYGGGGGGRGLSGGGGVLIESLICRFSRAFSHMGYSFSYSNSKISPSCYSRWPSL